jgi:hypothetical protein
MEEINNNNIEGHIFLPSSLLNDIDYDELDHSLYLLDKNEAIDLAINKRYVSKLYNYKLFKLAHKKIK